MIPAGIPLISSGNMVPGACLVHLICGCLLKGWTSFDTNVLFFSQASPSNHSPTFSLRYGERLKVADQRDVTAVQRGATTFSLCYSWSCLFSSLYRSIFSPELSFLGLHCYLTWLGCCEKEIAMKLKELWVFILDFTLVPLCLFLSYGHICHEMAKRIWMVTLL